jgi:glycosyltransferase involved in cell wall biosynthesis
MVALTIGMATYNDFDGVYFTVQALRLYQDLEDTELLVVDNYGCDTTRDFVKDWVKGRYIRATELVGTAAPRDRVFREARGKAVLCCDSHILFVPGAIAKLKAYYRTHPKTIDLLQGPLVYDDLGTMSTHFEPEWRDQMWGIWATDERGKDPKGKPFEIPMQGLGVFSCRKAAWPGFNPAFRGFGGEEGYIHEKFRQRGGRTLCLPWLRWVHRFQRPKGVPYPLTVDDKFRNYLIGHAELGLDLESIVEHFTNHLRPEAIKRIKEEARRAGSATIEQPANKVKKRKKARRSLAETSTAELPSAARDETLQDPGRGTASPNRVRKDPTLAATEEPGKNGSAPAAPEGDATARPALGFVFGSGDIGEGGAPVMRQVPLLAREEGEAPLAHVARVARLIEEANESGGTHFLIPTAAADWLDDYPQMTEYLATHHQPVAASMETGFLFALTPRVRIAVDGQTQADEPED